MRPRPAARPGARLPTAARSAQAPDPTIPTTRAPAPGPLPSAAAADTTPARSQPVTDPCGIDARRRDSPRLRLNASTSTSAWSARGVGSGASPSTANGGIWIGEQRTHRQVSGILGSDVPPRPALRDRRDSPSRLLAFAAVRERRAESHVDAGVQSSGHAGQVRQGGSAQDRAARGEERARAGAGDLRRQRVLRPARAVAGVDRQRLAGVVRRAPGEPARGPVGAEPRQGGQGDAPAGVRLLPRLPDQQEHHASLQPRTGLEGRVRQAVGHAASPSGIYTT